MIIRQATLEDEKDIIEICYETRDPDEHSIADKELFALRWALYYLRYKTEYCFVAEDSSGVKGYILSTPDTFKSELEYEEKILPIFKQRLDLSSPYYTLFTTLETNSKTLGNNLKNYPAHLHINMTSSCQGRGTGSKLLKAMEKNLKNKSITGVHLGVMESNTSAIKFYKKNGYREFQRHNLGEDIGIVIFMGKTLVNK